MEDEIFHKIINKLCYIPVCFIYNNMTWIIDDPQEIDIPEIEINVPLGTFAYIMERIEREFRVIFEILIDYEDREILVRVR